MYGSPIMIPPLVETLFYIVWPEMLVVIIFGGIDRNCLFLKVNLIHRNVFGGFNFSGAKTNQQTTDFNFKSTFLAIL